MKLKLFILCSIFLSSIQSASAGLYNVQYQYNCSALNVNITPDVMKVYNLIIMVILVLLLIIIIKVIQESKVVGLMIVCILVIFTGSFLPVIIDSVDSVDGCTSKMDIINTTGFGDQWITLSNNSIIPGTQIVRNSTFLAFNITDYTMDYANGKIKPLSTGNMTT